MKCSEHFRAGYMALALAAAALAISAGEAGAGVLYIDPGSSGIIPGGGHNDILDEIYGPGITTREGYYGSTIRLAGVSTLTFAFLGFEAGYDNEFLLDTDGNGSFELVFTTKAGGGTDINGKTHTEFGDTYTVTLDPLDFADGVIPFKVNAKTGGAAGSVINGSNPDDIDGSAGVNFFTSFDDDPLQTTGSSLVIYLDDAGGGPDEDHDDLGVRISAAAPVPATVTVPEPATIAVFSIGLAGIALTIRRRPG